MIAVRLGLYVVVLSLIAIVVVGQHHTTARDTLRAVLPRTLRWIVWSAILVAAMTVLDIVFIGW